MKEINIDDFYYDLPDERIAKFPVSNRDCSKLLIRRPGEPVTHTTFNQIGELLPRESLLVFNNTKVVRARIIMHKPTGARVEVLCLEPCDPADYERAFAISGSCKWHCIVGGLKKWKEGPVEIHFEAEGNEYTLQAWREEQTNGSENIVRFEWDAPMSFGRMLELLGKLPIPPYLNRDTEEVDYTRYQTVYSKFEGSVAAPTAGACGVLPAVLVPLYHGGTVSEEDIIKALYVASGIGAVIGFRACIAGAAGGCQAEIGSASAMAAGALVALRGGSAAQIGHAAAMTLKNLMGLVCDPVAGLVEVPCVKRNVVGAMNAVSCADMALAGIESRIPVDEVIDAMRRVGEELPCALRETAQGGLATTPTGEKLRQQVFGT